MNKKELKARLAAIHKEATAAEQAGDTEKLDKLLAEAEEINAKLENADKLAKIHGLANTNEDEGETGEGEEGNSPEAKATKRGKDLKTGKVVKMSKTAITRKAAISSTTVTLPKHTSDEVSDTFNDVSSLVDAVKPVMLDGGESYQRGFVKSYGEGDYTNEGAEAATAEPEFGYADITKTKITAYAEEPNEIRKLAPAAYDSIIGNSTSRAIRKKLAKEILVGTGTKGTLTGIFNAPEDIINGDCDIEISEITSTTLDEIIFAYGGDEDVEGPFTLVLNKKDLKTFSLLRNEDGSKTYEIKLNGNTGTIDGTPFIINSACAAISDVKTASGKFCMAYGPFYNNYEMGIFSDMDVQQSTEFRFKTGQIAHKGEIYVGGNVVAWNGFVRVKKG
jgi:HK97 family phage major capsid protein